MTSESAKINSFTTSDDFGRFTDFMRKLVTVPHSDAEKAEKKAAKSPAKKAAN